MNYDDLRYVGLYTDLLINLSTDKYNYYEINQMIQGLSGGMSAFVNVINNYVDNKLITNLTFSYSALTENVGKVQELLENVIYKTNFNDFKRLKERLLELKNSLSMGISNNGHRFAARRALSYISEEEYINEKLGGIDYLDFLTDICNNFDNIKNDLANRLNNVSKLLSKDNLTVGVTGNEKMLDKTINVFDNFYNKLNDKVNYNKESFKPEIKNEAFKAPFDVLFNLI
jgi:Zn-dependent M16 (insulinase) family peptidase